MGADRIAQPAQPTEGLQELRRAMRSSTFTGSTAGLASERCQVNYVGLPAALAEDFTEFCRKNPAPCPLMERLAPGNAIPEIAPHADIRTDIPRYRIYRDGALVAEPLSLESYWREDLVSFLLGCSYSFEASLLAAGIGLRHQELNSRVPMFRTNRATVATRHFSGPLVVSMRPIRRELVPLAVEITREQSWAHGAPVQVGNPESLGIARLDRPDYGGPVPIHPDELPVFWACGVTSQAVAIASRSPLMITHAPGSMLVTDLPVPKLSGRREG